MEKKETRGMRQKWLARWDIWCKLCEEFLDPLKEEVEEEAGILGEGSGEFDNDQGVGEDSLDEDSRPKLRSDRGEEWEEIATANIDLPSRWDKRVVLTPGAEEPRELEKNLREQQATGALDDLRDHLITTYALQQQAQTVSGAERRERVRERQKRKHLAVKVAAAEY